MCMGAGEVTFRAGTHSAQAADAAEDASAAEEAHATQNASTRLAA